MMPGMIMLWAGAIVDIPDGWHLCDGTEGTPDLRNKFVVGAGSIYDPGDNGGAASHIHTYTTPPHGHALAVGAVIAAGTDHHILTSETVFEGSVDSQSSLPPYYALAYIMKL